MKKVLFCVGYDVEETKYEELNSAVSGMAMAQYLMKLINKNEISVHIVSALKSKKRKFKYFKKYEKDLDEKNSITISPAICMPGRIFEILKTIYLNLWLFFYLIKHTHKGEQVFIYHSISKIPAYLLARKIKKLKYCLFVGEIYHNISHHNKLSISLENKMLSIADSYIFASMALENTINVSHKKSVVISGILSEVPKYEESFLDERIHIVYAGIINKDKGAFTTCDIAKLLDGKYHIHILGYGTDEDIDLLKDKISKIQDTTECKISYEGLMSGEKYQRFLQRCHIGLCPQISESKYNDSSFPSKISVYLANNLRVVAPSIKSIRENKLGSLIYFYDENNFNSIIDVIRKIDINEYYNSSNIIAKCNEEAIKGIKELFLGQESDKNNER